MTKYNRVYETNEIVIDVSPKGEVHITTKGAVSASIEPIMAYDPAERGIYIYIASDNIDSTDN